MRISNPTTPFIDVHGWFQAATERRELLAMDDRMLRDIGITRVDAARIAETPFRLVKSAPVEAKPAPPLQIDRAKVDAAIARAHQLRNKAIRDAFASLFRLLRFQPKARIRKLAPVAR
jgi:uncharacterized protein YjiS (DUF1127 family)